MSGTKPARLRRTAAVMVPFVAVLAVCALPSAISAADPAPYTVREIAIAATNIESLSSELTPAMGLTASHRGQADKTVARLLNLDVDAPIDQLRLTTTSAGDPDLRIVSIANADTLPASLSIDAEARAEDASVATVTANEIVVSIERRGDTTRLTIPTRAVTRDLDNLLLGKPRKRGSKAGDIAAGPRPISIRAEVTGVREIYARAQSNGAVVLAPLQVLRLEPYGTVLSFAAAAPSSPSVRFDIFEIGATPMTAAELREFTRLGRFATWTRFNNKLTGSVHWRADGSARVVWNEGDLDEEGTWSVKGDAVCTAWFKLRFNRELCVHHYRLDGDTTESFTVDGRTDGIYFWRGAGVKP